jgi:hypothetical protein
MNTWISLPYGGRDAGSRVRDLIAHIKASGRDFIIKGARKCVLAEHRKPQSLDYWLRTHATPRSDTMQMLPHVEAALVATGFFCSVKRRCPDSGSYGCKALELTAAAHR